MGAVGAHHATTMTSALQCSTVADLAAAVRRFWEAEEPPSDAAPLSV